MIGLEASHLIPSINRSIIIGLGSSEHRSLFNEPSPRMRSRLYQTKPRLRPGLALRQPRLISEVMVPILAQFISVSYSNLFSFIYINFKCTLNHLTFVIVKNIYRCNSSILRKEIVLTKTAKSSPPPPPPPMW